MSYKKSEGSLFGSSIKSINSKEIPPLDIERIKRANEIINELHPQSQTPLYDVLPFLKVIFNPCIKKQQRQNSLKRSEQEEHRSLSVNLQEPLQSQNTLNKKTRTSFGDYIKDKLRINFGRRKNQSAFDDPFIEYGYGVVAFFNILKALIYIFIALSALALPQILMYWKYNDQNYPAALKFSFTTLGNTGQSYQSCFQAPLELGNLVLKCSGTSYIAHIPVVGLAPQIHDTVHYRRERICLFNKEFPDVCSDFIGERLQKALNDSCLGKQQCSIKNINETIIDPNGQNQTCFTSKSYVFAQVQCFQNETLMENKIRYVGLTSVSLGICSCLIFTMALYYQFQKNELDFILWDMKTVTVNDFTAELKITDLIWDKYQSHISKETPEAPTSQIHPFFEFLASFIKTQTQQYIKEKNIKALIQKEDGKTIEINQEIAFIELDFKQSQLIELLRARGQKIQSLNFPGKRQIEAKINRYFISYKKQLERPVSAFITFEDTTGYNLFMDMVQKQNKDLNAANHQIIANNGPLPTDIIWEKRNITNAEFIKKQLVSIIGIILLILLGITLMLLIRWEGALGMAPLKKTDCSTMPDQYGEKLGPYALYAFEKTKTYFDNLLNSDIDQQYMNVIACFCKQYSLLPNVDALDDTVIMKSNHTLSQEYQEMCNTFNLNYTFAYFFNLLSSQGTVVLNYLLRLIIIFVIKFIGYGTESAQTRKIMLFVFIIQFFNTGPLPVLINANMSNCGIPLLNRIDFGIHPDFSDRWYNDVGKSIISTMIYNVWWPVAEFFLYFAMRLAFRIWDRNFIHTSWHTKQKSIFHYVMLYSGPQYLLHYKYSFIMNITFITFMFGAGMPILFPIALASFVVFYIMERLQVAYSYRAPPMMDESLSRLSVRILMIAPMLYLAFGFWMFNNIELFYNRTVPIRSLNDDVDTGHNIVTAFERFDHSTPLLLLLVILVILVNVKKWAWRIQQSLMHIDLEKFQIKTEQVSYFQALNKYQKKWLLAEELAAQKKFGIHKFSNETIRKLREETPQDKKFEEEEENNTELIGVMTYNILDNPIYQHYFQYVPEILEQRDYYIIDDWMENALGQSDYVKKNISFFYQPREEGIQSKEEQDKNQ